MTEGISNKALFTELIFTEALKLLTLTIKYSDIINQSEDDKSELFTLSEESFA